VATLIATAGGAGLSPIAPGTVGALVAIPLAYFLDKLGTLSYVLAIVAVAGVGAWAAEVYDEAWGTHDAQSIVVDEVAGMLLSVVCVPRTAMNLILGFLLFRLFDIWKPWPVRFVDQNVGGGIGCMADDLIAGCYAALLLLAIEKSGVVGLLAGYLSVLLATGGCAVPILG